MSQSDTDTVFMIVLKNNVEADFGKARVRDALMNILARAAVQPALVEFTPNFIEAALQATQADLTTEKGRTLASNSIRRCEELIWIIANYPTMSHMLDPQTGRRAHRAGKAAVEVKNLLLALR